MITPGDAERFSQALHQLPPRAVTVMPISPGSTMVIDGVPEAIGLDAQGGPWLAYSHGPRHGLQWAQYGGSVPGGSYCVGVIAMPYGGVQVLYACPV